MNLPVQETLPFEDLAEAQTASPWCQRWRAGKHSWRHVRDGGFDARNYRVDVIPEEEPAKTFVVAHHYSRSYPAVKVQFGLYDVSGSRRRLCGVAVFGVPVSTAVLTKPLPGLRPYTESLVCSRFVLLDECPGNSESWFLARCFDALLADGVRGVVSFADPVPRRTASGRLVMPGHVGTIYAATNAVYRPGNRPDGEAPAGRHHLPRPGSAEDPPRRAGPRIRRCSTPCARSSAAAARLRPRPVATRRPGRGRRPQHPAPRCAPLRVPARPDPPGAGGDRARSPSAAALPETSRRRACSGVRCSGTAVRDRPPVLAPPVLVSMELPCLRVPSTARLACPT